MFLERMTMESYVGVKLLTVCGSLQARSAQVVESLGIDVGHAAPEA